MSTPPAGISAADWLATPESVRDLVAQLQVLQQENEQLRHQLTSLALEVTDLRERLGRNSRNSSKPPSSDSVGFKPTPAHRKPSGRKRGGQQGHPGSGLGLLPTERCDDVQKHHPQLCRHCGTHLQGNDPEPLRHRVIEIPPITPLVIEHQLHRLICPCCGTSTCAELPEEVEPSPYGPRLSALVGLLSSAFPLSFGRTQALLDQLLGVEISRGAIATIRSRLSACLQEPVEEAMQVARLQPVASVDDTGAPTGNADGANPEGRRGWLWVMVTPVVTVFLQGLSRSAAAATELLGAAFAGTVVSDRFSAYNHLPISQRQLCWAHLIRDLSAMADRSGVSGEIGHSLLALQRQLFEHWHHWRDGRIPWLQLQKSCGPIRRQFEATLQQAVDLGCERGERTPWAHTARTCRQLLQRSKALWTFLEKPEVEPTNNAAERALRQAVIHRKVCHGVQSATGALCRSRLLTVTATLRQQGRDVWGFLEQAWVAHRLGGEMPSLVPDR